ncbi:MAG: AAA family ATPase, partial [Candidatus Methanomethylophilaceae archaeon]|nr:AAA family ATPase [Candidatus Methanomethylophilaceae archaeon]
MDRIMVRRQYPDRLIGFKDKPVIKTIVGIRRCGKSTLLMMYGDHLLENGVKPDDILMMNFGHMQDDWKQNPVRTGVLLPPG